MLAAAESIHKLADTIRTGPRSDYIFAPQEDVSLADIVDLLKIVRVGASSDSYLSVDFPQNLKRHFKPLGS